MPYLIPFILLTNFPSNTYLDLVKQRLGLEIASLDLVMA